MAITTLGEKYWGTAVPVNPDYDLIFNSLQTTVTNSGDTNKIWTDAITAATGSFIVRMVASFTSDLEFAVERVQHEVMLGTSRRPSSIYAITRMQGVHVQRKVPSNVAVRIARDTANTPAIFRIPAYSSWTIGNLAFFNRNDIVFFAGVELLTVTLNRGTITQSTAISNGQANQSFTVNIPQFRISDVDLFCVIAGQTWTRTIDGLWEQPSTAQVFQENTTNDGNVRLDFGDGVYGAIPPLGQFVVNYVIVQTSDYDASQDLNPPSVGSKVTCAYSTGVAGLTLGEMSPVIPEQSPSFYKKQAPYIRSGHLRGNNRKNLTALALEYTGVIDAKLLGQAEINPRDLRWMNSVTCTLLTSTVWGDADWFQFLQWMTKYSDSTRHFNRQDPSPVNIDFSINVWLQLRADLDSCNQQIQTLLQKMLTPSLGSLGASYNRESLGIYLSNNVRDGLGPLITKMSIVAPYDDINFTYRQYGLAGNISVNPQYDPGNWPKVVNGVVVPNNNIGTLASAGGM